MGAVFAKRADDHIRLWRAGTAPDDAPRNAYGDLLKEPQGETLYDGPCAFSESKRMIERMASGDAATQASGVARIKAQDVPTDADGISAEVVHAGVRTRGRVDEVQRGSVFGMLLVRFERNAEKVEGE